MEIRIRKTNNDIPLFDIIHIVLFWWKYVPKQQEPDNAGLFFVRLGKEVF